jgi:hypothetical protein
MASAAEAPVVADHPGGVIGELIFGFWHKGHAP